MVEKKILVSTVIIVLIVSVAGYSVGLFTTPSEETITVTSSTTITQTETITTTSTITTSKTNFPFHTFNPNEQLVGVINDKAHVLFTLSINGSIFRFGQTVNITAAITNLTPQNITVSLYEYHLPIFNDTGNEIWRTPISYWPNGANLRPAFEDDFKMGPFETIIIPRASTNWNLTGLKYGGPEIRRTIYSGEFVPEGQYQIEWTFAIEYTKDDGGRYLSYYIEPIILKFTVEP